MESAVIRSATVADANACLEIYRPYVEHTPITFEVDLPTVEQMAARIESAVVSHAWLVLEDEGTVIGYASAKSWDSRDAYRWACETGIYLDQRRHQRGGGRRLYAALLDRLTQRGYRLAIGRLVVPNEPSTKLHQALDFEYVGTLRAVGWKAGQWHDVALMQKPLGPQTEPPGPIRG